MDGVDQGPESGKHEKELRDSAHTARRTIFHTIAGTSYHNRPAYRSSPLYDQQSLPALEEDVRTIPSEWFTHDAHECVKAFVCHLPLAYMEFQPHDTYSDPTRYEMTPLVRAFLLKSLHGWEHETALLEHLGNHLRLRGELGLNSVPGQSTL
ncbi:hypothetical protein [Halomarina rubra]|uniref:Uncharacterized protein n=1 Tax=Halomarina rubra TaxID=2071873 RepID=A0ABD6AYI5_9EURY|nr:hypothetical protein [Halomarina rubra]